VEAQLKPLARALPLSSTTNNFTFIFIIAFFISQNLFPDFQRIAMDPAVRPSYNPSFGERLLVNVFHLVNKVVPWHKLPSLIGALNLDALRIELRQYNLYDGYASGTAQGNQTTEPMTDKRFEYARNSDGKFNSTEMPLMGCAGMRFGRTFPRKLTPKPTEEQLWNPNPRMLSERFMARKTFIPR
jgi:hypothetical protein